MSKPMLPKTTRILIWLVIWGMLMPLLSGVFDPIKAAPSADSIYLPLVPNLKATVDPNDPNDPDDPSEPVEPIEIEGPAKSFANALEAAADHGVRKAVLMQVFDTVNVGVYSAEGALMVRGVERGVGDFYLYEPEVDAIAFSLERYGARGMQPDAAQPLGGEWGIHDLTVLLNEWGQLPLTQQFTPEEVYAILVDGIIWAADNPNDPLAFIPLFVRERGRLHAQPYDLLQSPSLENVRFDAAQWFLIQVDFILPYILQNGPVDIESELVELSNGILQQSDAPVANEVLNDEDPSPCKMVGDGASDTINFGKWAVALYEKAANRMAKAAVYIDGLHGSVLAFSVLVYSMDEAVRGHYGHDGLGDPMVFRTKVEMVDQLPQLMIDCAWLAGVTLPPKGPIADVNVFWTTDGLDRHGALDCSMPCMSKTDANGVASLTLTPHQEAIAGKGITLEETGLTTGVAMYQSRFGNVLGSVNQLITPKSGTARWFIEYHRPAGWYGTVTFTEVEKSYESNRTTSPTGGVSENSSEKYRVEKQTWILATETTLTEGLYAMSGVWNVSIREKNKDYSLAKGISYWCGAFTNESTTTVTGNVKLNGRSEYITLNVSEGGGPYFLVNADSQWFSDFATGEKVNHHVATLAKAGTGNCENTDTTKTETVKYSTSERGPSNVNGEIDPDEPDVIEGKKVYTVGDITQTWTWRLERSAP